jgi:hypothetical protein
MWYVVTSLVGMLAGTLCTGLAIMAWYRKVRQNAKLAESQSRRAREATDAAEAREREQAEISRRLHQDRQELDGKIVSHRELEQANRILKRDLQNVDVQLRKLELDVELERQRHKELADRSGQLARRYLADSAKSAMLLGADGLAGAKVRLSEVIAHCRSIGFPVSEAEESQLLAQLEKECEVSRPMPARS